MLSDRFVSPPFIRNCSSSTAVRPNGTVLMDTFQVKAFSKASEAASAATV